MGSDFTTRLAAEIKRKGATKKALAEAVGVHRSALHEWETGAVDPSVSRLAALADYFGCTMDWLWGRSDVREPAAAVSAREALAAVAPEQLKGAVDALLETLRIEALAAVNALQGEAGAAAGRGVTDDEAQVASEGIGANAETARGERPSRNRRGAGGRPA